MAENEPTQSDIPVGGIRFRPGSKKDLILRLLAERDRQGGEPVRLPARMLPVLKELVAVDLVNAALLTGPDGAFTLAQLTELGRAQSQSRPRSAADDGLRLESLNVDRSGVRLRMTSDQASDAVLTIAEAFAQMLDDNEATNYVELTVRPRKGSPLKVGSYIVNVRRGGHPTPHDLRLKAEEDAEMLRERVRELEKALEKVIAAEEAGRTLEAADLLRLHNLTSPAGTGR